MLETAYHNALNNHQYGLVALYTYIVTVTLAGINHWVSGSNLFLISFTALAIAHPVVDYMRSVNKGDLERHESFDEIIGDHVEEITTVWMIFIAVLAGFLTAHIAGLTTFSDVSLDAANVVSNTGFQAILTNNALVAAYTALLSFVSVAGLVFVLAWNAGLLASYASQTRAVDVALVLPHGLLEVAGYVSAGLAGSLLAMRFQLDVDDDLWAEDLSFLVAASTAFIVVAAVIETL